MAKVIITGASGGFGALTVKTLLKKKHQVAATMRSATGKNATIAKDLKSLGAEIIEMDVTNEKSVSDGVLKTLQTFGGLDVAINNAGIGVLGLQETFTTQDWQKVFDVNVFGVQRMCRAVLPHFRERHSGLLINISSLLGRITVPYYGPYNATKWAVEAMTENYRSELSQLGIDCCLVEPGGFPTTFMDNLIRPSDTARLQAYGSMVKQADDFFASFEKGMAANPAQNPQNVADAIATLIETAPGKRSFRTIVDKMGMGDHLQAYNTQLAQITTGIYSAFGMGDMLTVKTTR